jgi:hypothetical protein
MMEMNRIETNVSLDVEILEVKRVLPHIDANDRNEVQKRVLVRSRRKFEAFGHDVVSLRKQKTRISSLLRWVKRSNVRASPTRNLG